VALFDQNDIELTADIEISSYFSDDSQELRSINSLSKPQAIEKKQISSDLELFARVSAGDELAMQEIYQRYATALLHFVKNYLADSNEADDIVHETMLEIWRRAERFQGRSSAKSWIFSIAKNKSIDKNRKASKSIYIDVIPESPTEDPEPDVLLASSNDAQYIRECIDKLSQAHRMVISLVYFQGLSYKEVSEVIDRPVGTVKTRILHAKRLLMHMLPQSKN